MAVWPMREVVIDGIASPSVEKIKSSGPVGLNSSALGLALPPARYTRLLFSGVAEWPDRGSVIW